MRELIKYFRRKVVRELNEKTRVKEIEKVKEHHRHSHDFSAVQTRNKSAEVSKQFKFNNAFSFVFLIVKECLNFKMCSFLKCFRGFLKDLSKQNLVLLFDLVTPLQVGEEEGAEYQVEENQQTGQNEPRILFVNTHSSEAAYLTTEKFRLLVI